MNGKSAGKAPIISTLIATLCIIVYIAALSYTALMIFNSVSGRRAVAEEEFDNLTDRASAAGVLGFMDEPFIRTIQDEVDGSLSLMGVIISGPNGEYAFERERGTVISWVNNTPRFKTRFGTSYPPRHMPLRIEGQRNVNIQVVFGYIDYELCVKVLKQALLAILAALALAFFTLLTETVLLKNRAVAAPVPDIDIDTGPGVDIPDDDFADIEAKISQVEPEPDDVPLDPVEERLDDELRSSTQDGKDLIYMVMDIKNSTDGTSTGPAGEDSPYQPLIRAAAKFFAHRDLIFKRESGGIAVICPDTGLDTGVTKAEDFYRLLREEGEGISADTDIRIGLSSRAERLIRAERLMFEAEESLRRAAGDSESHIVAFKSDPKKYRAFIQARGLEA